MPVWLVGSLVFLSLFVLPNKSSALEPLPPRGHSKIMGGAALMVLGGIVTGFGAVVYVANENASHASCVPCAEKGWIFPTVLMSVGGAMFLGGVPLVVLGAVENRRGYPPTTASLFASPTSLSARLSF